MSAAALLRHLQAEPVPKEWSSVLESSRLGHLHVEMTLSTKLSWPKKLTVRKKLEMMASDKIRIQK